MRAAHGGRGSPPGSALTWCLTDKMLSLLLISDSLAFVIHKEAVMTLITIGNYVDASQTCINTCMFANLKRLGCVYL